jgi:hypothetical protein
LEGPYVLVVMVLVIVVVTVSGITFNRHKAVPAIAPSRMQNTMGR